MPPTSAVIRGGERQQLRAVQQQFLAGGSQPAAGSCGSRPRRAPARRTTRRVCSCEASVRRPERTLTSCRLLRRLFDRSAAAEHDLVGQRTLSAPDCGAVELLAIASSFCSPWPLGRWFTSQSFCGGTGCGPVGPAALVGAAERRRRRPGGAHNCKRTSRRRALDFQPAMSCRRPAHGEGRHRVLPDQALRPATSAPRYARCRRAHVAVGQLDQARRRRRRTPAGSWWKRREILL